MIEQQDAQVAAPYTPNDRGKSDMHNTDSEPESVRSNQEFLCRTVVIIPARNERDSIQKVLGDLPQVGQIIVVDNGSTDGTGDLARESGATVVREERPGYGQACLAGLRHLQENAPQLTFAPDYIVFLDADYSDHPDLLPDLVAPIHDEECDFVLGSRLLGQREKGAMPPQSIYGNKLAVFLMKFFWGHAYTDLGPFRAIHRDCLVELGMTDTNYGWTVEMQIKAIEANLRIREIPVPYRCRIGKSKISGTISGTLKAGTKILLTIAKYRLKA